MSSAGIDPPDHRQTILAKALDEYCRENHVDPASTERNDAERLLALLFEQGHRTVGDLKAALRAAIKREG
jgi:hypothetical protein